MRVLNPMTARLRWPEASGSELAIAVVFIQLIANARFLSHVLGPRAMLVLYGGFALSMYMGVAPLGHKGGRGALSWVGAPWRHFAPAFLGGCSLGLVTTMTTAAMGHSVRIVEPVQNEILAVTLSPILEEVCLRGLIFPLLVRTTGNLWAVTIMSVVFAFAHWPASIVKLTFIALMGMVYGIIRTQTGSTVPAAITHTGYNTGVLATALSRLTHS